MAHKSVASPMVLIPTTHMALHDTEIIFWEIIIFGASNVSKLGLFFLCYALASLFFHLSTSRFLGLTNLAQALSCTGDCPPSNPERTDRVVCNSEDFPD